MEGRDRIPPHLQERMNKEKTKYSGYDQGFKDGVNKAFELVGLFLKSLDK